MDEAKARAEQELKELEERIKNLELFLFSHEPIKMGLSIIMQQIMFEQLNHMKEYAKCLESRLIIWGKTDAEIYRVDL